MLRYTTRPISDRTWLRPSAQREVSRFTASWTNTLDLLEREYEMLGGDHLVIEVDVPERAIRNDGAIRADARANSPAVVVAFDTSKHGPLLYRSDQYGRLPWQPKMREVWQHNVRAVAMTLEALRAVDRHGASRRGEQYRGYKALGAGTGEAASHMTSSEAWTVLRAAAAIREDEDLPLTQIIRTARARAHPDRHAGARAAWDHVERAVQVLTRPQTSQVRAVGQ